MAGTVACTLENRMARRTAALREAGRAAWPALCYDLSKLISSMNNSRAAPCRMIRQRIN